MISEERDGERGTRTLAWAILASILIHALVLPAVFWSWSRDLIMPAQPHERESIVSSTAVRIEKRQVPRPEARPVPPQPQSPPVRPQRQSITVAAPAAAQRRELARLAPTAPPESPKQQERPASSFEQQLAQQQQQFSQEVARLHAQDNPLSIAQQPQHPAATYQRTYFDVPGHRRHDAVEALLIPMRHWNARAMSCYYVRYVAQFTSGASEDGVIPWPVCYPANDDAMAHPPWPHDLPIPIPPRDYVLPSGTYLTPLLKSLYDRRSS